MKKLLAIFAALSAFATSAVAQYQVGNSDFESWVDNSSYYEPENWHSFGSATGTMSSLTKSDQLTYSTDDVHGGEYSAYLSTSTIIGVVAQGTMTTGQMSAGAITPSDASGNYAFSDSDNEGYFVNFGGVPDSLTIWVKYYAGGTTNVCGKVAGYLHGAGRMQDPYSSSNDFSATLYAQAVTECVETKYDDDGAVAWQRVSVPFVYGSDAEGDDDEGTYSFGSEDYDLSDMRSAVEDEALYAFLVVSTNAVPGGGDNSDYIYVDDMEFVYNSELSRFVYNYSSSACYEYEIGDDGVIAVAPTITDNGCKTATSTSSYALYNDGYKSAVQYETAQAKSAGGIVLYSNGVGASIDTVYDAFSGVLTITVKGDNYSEDTTNYHTYTAQFRPKISKTSTNKGLYAQVTENGTVTSLDTTTVRRLTYSYDASRSIRFTNLTIGGTTDSLSLRDLVTTETDDGKSFSATGTVEIGGSSYEYVLSGDSVASDTLASSYAIELEGLGVSIKVGYAYSVEAFVDGVYSGSSLVFYGDTVTLSSNDVQVLADGTQLSLTDNGDGTYSFVMPGSDVAITATTVAQASFHDYLLVALETDEIGYADPDTITVYLDSLSDGTYNFALYNFTFGGTLSLGNILLYGITPEVGDGYVSFSTTDTLDIVGTPAEIQLTGKVVGEKLYFYIYIPNFSNAYNVHVYFGTYKVAVADEASELVSFSTRNGTDSANYTDTVTITVADGVSLYSVSASTESGEEVELTSATDGDGNSYYYFIMPAEAVTITATAITDTATYEDYLLVSGGTPEAKSVELYTLSDGSYVLKISDLSLSLGGTTIDVGDVEVALSGTTSALSGSGTVLSSYPYTLEGSVESGKLHFTMVVMSSINVYFGTYSITLVDESSLVGSVASNVASDSTVQGDAVTITPADGAEIASLFVETASGTVTELEAGADGTYTFTMPGENVTIEASATTKYAVSLSEGSSDYVTVSAATSASGETVTITIIADGVTFYSVSVTTESGEEVELAETDEGYTFTMPSEGVTVTAAEVTTLASYSFTDYLLVTINGSATEPSEITVYLDSLSDGTYYFKLNNFVLVSGDDYAPVGNIVLSGIEPIDNGDGTMSFSVSESITITDGDDSVLEAYGDDAFWLGSHLGEVPIELVGTKTADGKLYFHIDIDMTSSLGQIIGVDFGTYAIAVADEASELVSFSTRNGTDAANYTDTVYVTLADGVEADSVTITAGTETVTLVASDDGYYFIMPEAAVTITATGSEEEDSSSSEDSSDSSESESSDSSSDSSDSSSDSETAIAYVKAASSKLYAEGRSIVVVSSSARQAKVYSLTGKLIASKELVKGETRIGSLPNGVYMVRLSDGTKGKVKITSR